MLRSGIGDWGLDQGLDRIGDRIGSGEEDEFKDQPRLINKAIRDHSKSWLMS